MSAALDRLPPRRRRSFLQEFRMLSEMLPPQVRSQECPACHSTWFRELTFYQQIELGKRDLKPGPVSN